jgi:nitroreductase
MEAFAMELLDGIITRATCRGFLPAPVPKDILDKILHAACNSPSYTNSQPWELAIVSGAKKNELSKIIYELARQEKTANPDIQSPATWPSDIDKRIREHGARRLSALGVTRDDKVARNNLRLSNYEFYGAPCVVFLFIDNTLGEWSIFDTGLFAQNFILAAHSFDIASCLQASIVNYPDAIRTLLNIPQTKKLVIGIAIGYMDKEAKLNNYRALKMKPEEFVRWY